MAFQVEVAKTISWFYAAAFGRTPVPNSTLPDNGDIGGVTFWTNAFLAGEGDLAQYNGDLDAIGDYFTQSPEFQARYPDAMTNEQYVTALYDNMLNRAPDLAGFQFWVNMLNSGESRGAVLVDFANTPENQNEIPNQSAALDSFILFIANDTDQTITPDEAGTWLVANPQYDASVIDLVEDTTAPTVDAGQTDTYSEGSVAGATLYTVAAEDNPGGSGLASFAIVSGNDNGYFQIDADGDISLTTAGAAAGVASNDSTVDPDVFTLGVTATDKAGNTSTAENVVLTVADVTPPALDSATLGGSSITLVFDEPLNASSIPAGSSFAVLQGSTLITVNTVTISGAAVTLGLVSAPAGTVTVSYTPPATNPLQDAAGNDAAAITNQTVVTDTNPPTLTSTTPADNAVDVAVGDNIVLVFSEPVKAGTGDIKLVSVSGADNRTIAVTDSQVTISGNQVIINPTTDLSPGQDYSVQMAAGVLTDTSGNPFAGILNATTFNFTTVQPVTADLTSGSDILSGNFFDGTLDILAGQSVETLTNGDRLTGTGTNPTMNVQIQQYAHTVTPLNLTGIQTVNVDMSTLLPTGAEAAAAPTLNLANADTSIKNFTVSSQTQAFTLTNIPNVIGSFGIVNNGGQNFTAIFQNPTLSGSSDAITVSVNQVTPGTSLVFQPTTAGTNGIETITVNSTGGLPNVLASLSDGNGNSLKTVNVTGTQDLTLPLAATDTTVTTVDANTFTGRLTFTAAAGNAQNMTVTGGTNNDVINVNGYTASDVINGGNGTDRLVLTNAEVIAATTKQTNVSNIEIIGLANASAMTANFIAGLGVAPSGLNAPAATPVVLANFGATGLRLGTSTDTTADGDLADNTDINSGLGANSVVNYAAGTGSLDLQNSPSNTFSLTANVAGAATTDVLNITAGTTTSGILTGAAAAAADTAGWGTGAIILNGAETVNLTSQGGANTFGGVFTLTDTASTETLNILGNQNLTFVGAISANVINASAFTGNLTTTAVTVSPGGVIFTGGTGSDILFGSAIADVIDGGAGNDTITGGLGLDIMTGGSGADTFSFVAAAGTTNNPVVGNFDTITDFVVGTDKLQFTTVVDVVSGQQTAVQAAVTGLAAGSTSAQIANAMALANTTNLGVAFATFGGNTYVLFETTGANTAFTVADDIFIQLTGVTTLPTFGTDVVA